MIKIIIKSIMVLAVLTPCVLLAQESRVTSGNVDDNNTYSPIENIKNIKKNVEVIQNKNEQLKDIIKENFDDTIANANNPKNTDTKQQSANLDNFDNSEKSDNAEPSSLVDKIQGGLGNVLLGNGKLSSLMFDEKSNSDIDKAVDSFKTGQLYSPNGAQQKTGEEIDPNRKSYAFLASIMYINDNYWTVWVNNKKITSDDNNKNSELFINSVSKDKASITWTMSPTKWKILLGLHSDDEVVVNSNNQVVTKFELKPNQSYLLASASVIEGNPENTIAKKVTTFYPTSSSSSQ